MNTIKEILTRFETKGIIKEDAGLDDVCAFQDFIGRKSMKEIHSFYAALDKPTRKTFVWAAGCCLSQDMFIEVIKHVVCHAITLEIETSLMDEHDSRMADIIARENRMFILENENAAMKETISALREVRNAQEKTIASLAEKAQAFDTIKKALNI